jgi:hypothetical protein
MRHPKSLHVAVAIWLAALAVMVVMTVSNAAAAQYESKGVTRSTSTTVKATIIAIDKEHRILTLRGPTGNDTIVHADAKVQRFNELKIGDVISATFVESVALNVRKPGTAPPPELKDSVVRDTNRVGATVTQRSTISVKITGIDMDLPSVTAKGPQGNSYTFKVKDKSNLKDLKVGDNVDITYTEALLTHVEPAK